MKVKRKLKSNMVVKYKKLPKEVDSLSDMLSKGIFYGRFRINSFGFDKGSVGKSHYTVGVGGSLIYKSAKFKGVSFTGGLYTSQNPIHMDSDMEPFYRSGKDTFSRYKVETEGDYSLNAIPQLYLEYKKNRDHIKVGRFLVETFLLKSHDTKMIPNAFEGVYGEMRSIPKTKLQVAYITKQKLRNHEHFHHPFAYGDDKDDPFSKWTENDDGGMHRGLTVSRLKEKGIDDRLIVFEARNRSIKNLTLRTGYTAVPDLLSSLMVEGAYRIKFYGFQIKPSLRYMRQFDNGAGAIGGANLRTDTVGYSDPDSLDSSMIAARIDLLKDATSIRIGYSKIEDKGDLVTPWDAQPTAGYSRAMSRRNWYANTETFLIRADYDFSKKGLVDGLRGVMRYAIQDFDDGKSGVPADLNVLTIDLIKKYKSMPNLYTKLRTAFVSGEQNIENADGSFKTDPSYNSIRLELNYLF